MSSHTEWVEASESDIEYLQPGEFEDDHGTANDKPVLLLSGNDVIAVEGTEEELTDLVDRLAFQLGFTMIPLLRP